MEGPQGRQRVAAFLLHPVVAVVLSVALFAAGPAIALTHGSAKGWNVVAFGAVAVLSAARTVLSAQEAGGFKSAANKGFERAVGLGLYPLESLSLLCRTIDGSSADKVLENLRESVLETALRACGPNSDTAREKRRSVIYEFDAGDRLRFVKKKGRSMDPKPRPDFVSTGNPERDVVAWVRGAAQDTPVYDIRDDVTKPPHSRGGATGEHYRSLVSIPIYTEGKAYGLLAVDSKDPKSFCGLDGQALRMLATILAAGLAHVEKMHSLQT
jgi:GAF domain-containing protein